MEKMLSCRRKAQGRLSLGFDYLLLLRLRNPGETIRAERRCGQPFAVEKIANRMIRPAVANRDGGIHLVAANDDRAADEIWNLVGHSITAVRPRSSEHLNDPVFALTGDYLLEIEADSDLDPWVLRLRFHTFVGSL